MTRLAVHLYPSPMDNASRLLRMGRSIVGAIPDLEVRLVGLRVDDRFGLEPVQDRLVIDRVGSPRDKRDTLLSRVDKVGGWFRRVYAKYRREPLALVAAHTVFSLPLAVALGRARRVPVIYNPHELETRTPTMTGAKGALARAIESSLIRRCAMVTCVNERIADWYAQEYRIDRPVVLYNYPSATAERPARDLRAELGLPDDELLFVHTGNITGGRNVPAIVAAFEQAARHHVLFVGRGDLQPEVDAAAARSRFVHRMDPVPPDEVLSVVKGADLALCLIQPLSDSYAWSSPNKLFEALAAGTPPVCSDLPEARSRLGALADELVLPEVAADLPDLLRRVTRADAERYARLVPALPTWEDGIATFLDGYRALVR